MFKLLLLVFALTFSVQNVNSARILAAVIIPSYSHQMFFQQLWRELAIRGHDVVVITTDPTNEQLPNFKEISIKESYPMMRDAINKVLNMSAVEVIWSQVWVEELLNVAEYQLNLPQIQELLNNKTEHFDLLMMEQFVTPAAGIQHRFNCPLIGVLSLDAMLISHEIMGNAEHAVLYPGLMLPFQENLSLLQRVIAGIMRAIEYYSQNICLDRSTKIGRKYFGEDMPSIREIIEKTDMLMINANPVFSAIRPHAPSTISLAGGIHMKPEKPLPKELKDFLDSATNGAIYFSLGSNVKSNELNLNLRQTIMETLGKLPYKILWKFEEDNLPGKPDNVMITKWAPQQDVLRHKNIKLFITQGGLQSLEESLYSHIPVVVMPFFGDQDANANKVEVKGMGVVVDRHNLNVENFKSAILEVLNNPKYKETVTKLARQIQDKPKTPLENAVWWTEYVLRHKGAQHLKGPRIPLYQYYYLDVLFVLGTSICLLVGLLVFILKCICKSLGALFKSKETQNNLKLKKN